jgi:amino acid adenylation domain-containing protein
MRATRFAHPAQAGRPLHHRKQDAARFGPPRQGIDMNAERPLAAKLAFDPARPLLAYVDARADAAPDAPAVLLADRVVSYAALLDLAEGLALRLRAAGVGPGDHVGLLATRGLTQLAGMLAVLRAEACCVPLDPGYSDAAQLGQIAAQLPFAAIFSSTAAEAMLTAPLAPDTPRLPLDDATPCARGPGWPQVGGEAPATMVFTSGTTGAPKGVVLPQRGLAAFTLNQPVIGLRPEDRVLHSGSLACDGGLIEVWSAFMAGAALAPVEAPKPALPELAKTMIRHKVTVTSQYAGLHNLLVDHHLDAFATVRLAMAGGDVLSPDHIRRLLEAHPGLRMVNIYGPSETTCISLVHDVRLEELTGAPIPIGRPLDHEQAFVVDDALHALPDGERGQLVIGGAGVTLGYYGLPGKTDAAFIDDPRPGHSGKVYLTGDLALRRPCGTYEFFGRADRQIKLGGRRIELDGVEHVLRNCAGVHDAVVVKVSGPRGDARIGALLQPEGALPEDAAAWLEALREEAGAALHRQMLPRHMLVRPEVPLNKTGKADRHAVVAMIEATLAPAPAAKPEREAAPASGPVRARIAAIWDEMLGCGDLADGATFFDAGGTSLQLIEAHARLQEALALSFDLMLLFETPRLGDLAARLAGMGARAEAPEPAPEPAPAEAPSKPRPAEAGAEPIAIIGLSARVPGASSMEAFWQHIRQGDNLIHRFDPEELEDVVPPETRAAPNYVPARSVLDDVEMFDAKFFDILPREAELIDPQARVFLELCVEALENAALDPARAAGAIGVYAGCSTSTYMLHNVMGDRATVEAFTSGFQIGNYTTLTGNITDTLATRVAFKLNLTGPALTLHTACSTSLTAIAQAVTALRAGQCRAALAGGVSITFPQRRGYLAQEGGMSSPDGLCRPFDAKAGGTVFGHGGGVLVLKRLADALADGDRVEAVIRGVGLNNDGADKMAFTAPSVTGQAEAIRAAHRDAGVAPETIGYVECHGTATPLGDPIEIRALSQAYGELPEGTRVALGSVKGNIGHLDAGAGVVGIAKVVEMLKRREIPPVAHFKAPNPRLGLEATPFAIPAAPAPWASEGPRRAGVSGFGVGGTNVHVVLEEPPVSDRNIEEKPDRVQILPLSAKSPEALALMARDLAETLEHGRGHALADVAFTLQEGRSARAFRLAVAARDPKDAAARLRAAPAVTRPAESEAPPLAFLFPGQGGQYPGMAAGLAAEDPAFAECIETGAEVLRPVLDDDLAALLLCRAPDDAAAAEALRQTRLAQPALVLVQYATAQYWQARGLTPARLLGHSVGEFTSAALSGVLGFEDALRLVAERGRLMQDMPPGAMLSVRAAEDEIAPHLDGTVDLAAANAPKMQVYAGEAPAIDALAARLEAAGIACRRLHTSHAFHSRMMEPALPALEAAFAAARFAAPRIPMVSAMTGGWLEDDEATDPAFWARQARAPVRFAKALAQLCDGARPALVETGCGKALSAFAAQSLPRDSYAALCPSLPGPEDAGADAPRQMAATLGALWSAGAAVDWARATRRGHRKLALPGTVFLRKRHWIDPPAPAQALTAPAPVADAPLPATELPAMQTPAPAARKARLTDQLLALFADLSGEDLGPEDAAVPFLELGFDSLFMGQATQALARDFGVTLTFRSLLTDHPTLEALAKHLDATLPAEPETAAVPDPAPEAAPAAASAPAPAPAGIAAANPPAAPAAEGVQAVLQAQMQTMQAIFAEQLRALGAQPAAPALAAPQAPAPAPDPKRPAAEAQEAPAERPVFTVGRAQPAGNAELTEAQLAFARDLAQRYSARFPGSKTHTQEHREVHADPRTAAGFRAEWKELTFPIVAARAKGAHIEDVDGNRLVDLVNGFGQTAFGHSPDFVAEAVARQMERGFPIGPQADLAGPTARRFARMVGHERVTFCNTGSEAVMAAMRLARAVTGRQRIVVFAQDYHGQFDEVLVKGRARGEPAALPLAPGIPRDSVANMVVLTYGDPASLDWIRDNGAELAAVVVEPVQSRAPEHRPADFLRELREITRTSGSALVVDEVVTGFRTHARGMQGVWGIEADMATYGKVVGGGMPVGVLAGKARFMDALDGGQWAFGDDSTPQVPPTFFAGTFVRHPLVVAAVDAVLDHLERKGDELWQATAERTGELAARMNAALAARGLPDLVKQYSSWFVIKVSQHDPRATLLFPLMRLEGVHVLDGFCGFLTTAHGAEECDRILAAFETALDALQGVGILAPADGRPAAVPAPRPVAVPEGPVPLTESQREIWMAHQLGDLQAAAFNEGLSIRLDGPLDRAALQAALDDVVARHDALRLRFARDGSSFTVAPLAPVALAEHDLSCEEAPEAALADWLQREAAQPIDIVTGPPTRLALLRLGPEAHVLVLTAHHIVCDGWSFNVICTDLAALYTARLEGTAAGLPPAASYAAAARRLAATAPAEATRDFWRRVYADVPALPELPTDRPRPAVKSHAGATVSVDLPADLTRGLRKAGAPLGATLFSMLFAALQITLGRLSGSGQVVLGVPTAGQALPGAEPAVGHAVNFLPIRADFAPGDSARDHLRRVSDAVMEAMEHGDITLGTLVQDLALPRDLNRLPLTEVQFNLERVPEGLAFGPARAQLQATPKAAVNYDLFFNMVECRDGLRVEVDYSTALYDAATVRAWVAHLECVARALAEGLDRPLAELPLLTDEGERALADGGNDTAAAYDNLPLPALVARSAAAHPGRIAVSGAERRMSYAELERESDALAALIQARLPQPGQRVGVAVERGCGLPVALLAVLKAGHAYVPLDPAQPEARLRDVLEGARAAAILGPEATAPLAGPDRPRIDPAAATPGAQPQPVPHDPEAAAYVMFTSGSTGKPKGVAVPHRAVANFLASMAREPGLGAEDRLLSVTTISFDIAVLELFLPLTVGAEVEIAGREAVLDGFRVAERLASGEITAMQATPTYWAMLLEAGFTPRAGLKMLVGGEPLPSDLAERLGGSDADLWNMYGPTETTIWSSVARVTPGAPVTIGAPIANTEMHVLDAQDRLCPPGVAGELNIGGDGLALGYFDRPDLTQAAFREVALAGRLRRLYRTGDLAIRNRDGSLTLLGRRDGQVKLRGFRIELGEIEARLRRQPGIAAAAVAVRPGPSGTDRLVAYVVPRPGAVAEAAALSAALAAELPDYMVPTGWMVMEALPQTANGKLDRKALPEAGAADAPALAAAAAAPATPTEEAIATVWRDVLGVEALSVTETLFALGIDSLAMFRLAARLMQAGHDVEARDIMAHPSVRDLAALVDARREAAPAAKPALMAFARRTRMTGT